MSSLQYELEYEEEERADHTREQDDYYSIGNYDFDPSYEFDNGPREDENQHEEYQYFYNNHNDHYYEEEQRDYYDLPFEPEEDYFEQEEEYEYFQQEENYDQSQQQEEYEQEFGYQEHQESTQKEISDYYYEEESHWLGFEEEEQNQNEIEELEHDFEIQAMEEIERENHLQSEAYFASEQEKLQQQQQQIAEREYQLQHEHDQQIHRKNEMQRSNSRVGGYNHFADQETYSLRDHLPNFVEYRHDLNYSRNKRQSKRMRKKEKSRFKQNYHAKRYENEITKSPNPYFTQQPGWNQHKRSKILDKGRELFEYPFHIVLGLADRAISKIINVGFKIGTFPLKSIYREY